MPKTKAKRTEAQKRADEAYSEKNKKNQLENFANVSATFKKAEAEYIRAIYTAHEIKPADAIRAAARYLLDGGTIQAKQEPITPTQDKPTESKTE